MRLHSFVAVLAVNSLVSLAVAQTNFAQGNPIQGQAGTSTEGEKAKIEKVVKSDKEWRQQLSRIQYKVTRQAGTERAFSGKYWKNKREGTYLCVCCGLELFSSKTKFQSGTGWPSFYAPINREHVWQKIDRSSPALGPRMEILCSRCDAHLGHVFNDGPPPTGLRFCMNSAALDFETPTETKKRKELEEKAKSEASERESSSSNSGNDNEVSQRESDK